MTRQDFWFKWMIYALGLLPLWVLETMVLPRLPFLAAVPLLLPLAAVAVAVLEGAVGGAGFGLFVGIVADAVYPGTPGGMILALPLVGALSGGAAQYILRQNYLGCLLCAAVTLTALDGTRVVLGLIRGIPLPALLAVALPELFWSLLFSLPVYGIFRLVANRVGGDRLA